MGDYEEEDIKYGPPGSRKDEYKALPKFNEEKPMIGPKIDGQIKVVYKSFLEGYSNQDDEFAKMEAMGLPTGKWMENINSIEVVGCQFLLSVCRIKLVTIQ